MAFAQVWGDTPNQRMIDRIRRPTSGYGTELVITSAEDDDGGCEERRTGTFQFQHARNRDALQAAACGLLLEP
ncbi:hypothetical protein E4U10_002755 [Claviceps purpurea]|nr:hypothetical protein E4U11_001916 [Claviceps purpurea]KAG6194596.1 hypothetical protein E4U10_002755 [Claviceps purpurea]